jgi:serine protease Do
MSVALALSERRTVVFTSLVSLALGILLGLAATLDGGRRVPAHAAPPDRPPQIERAVSNPAPRAASPARAALASGLPDFTEVVRAVVPSVVTVRSQRTVEGSGLPFGFFHPFEDPRGRPERRLQRGLGSGVVVDARGHILTNNHVVEGSSKVEVLLSGGRRVTAKIRGTDPLTDLAVLEVPAAEDLQPITIGSSADLEVGAWVLAVGSPFAETLAHSVTAGIVSAKGRSNIRLAEIEDFIQTDAAINPGNSGGALVDTSGRLVGINTAIATGSGGFQGIGFAIPIDMARQIMDTLIESGRVVRGYLGVVIQDLTPDMARAGDFEAQQGAIISRVEEDGPAARAGLRPGDVVLQANGQEVRTSAELRNLIAATPPGTRVTLTVERDRARQQVAATLAEKPAGERRAAGTPDGAEEGLGLMVRDLTPAIADQLGMRGERGVVVEEVEPGSAADEAGLQPGDVIKEVNRRAVASVAQFRSALRARQDRGVSLFLVRRGEDTVYVTVPGP